MSRLRIRTAIAASLFVSVAAYAAVPTPDADFIGLMHDAMGRMMLGMGVRASGNADVDFAAMMIPHHRGAIDMAVAELRYGHDEQLRRIAQEIIVDQQQEIVVMDAALHQHGAPSRGTTAMDPMNHGAAR